MAPFNFRIKFNMNVLSLFDGMGCGRLALQRAGIPVQFYFSSEIDQFARKVTYTKWPQNIQKASVVDVSAYDLPKIDMLIGGSPCQGFSNSGKGLNFDDPRSALFFEYVRILEECKKVNPDVLFLLENVRMKKEWEDTISRTLEIQPICINSALVSAQNRERLYWTNISMATRGLFSDNYCTIGQPKDKNIYLKDVLQPTEEVDEKYYVSEKSLARILRKTYSHPQIDPEKTGTINTKNNSGQLSVDSGTTLIREPRRFVTNNNGEWRETEKALCIDANYFKGMDNHGQITMVREPIQINPSTESGGKQTYQQNRIYDTDGICPALTAEMGGQRAPLIKIPQADRIYSDEDKSITLGARQGGLGAGTGLYNVKERIRRLTPIEVCRLQGVPDDYFFNEGKQIVSDSQIYKMCGNGWNVDTIVWILSHINQGTEPLNVRRNEV